MSESAERMIAQMLSKQMGIKPEDIEGMLTSDPLAAMCALSMSQPRSEPSVNDRPQFESARAVDRLIRVAMMVGACQRCLGDDSTCAHCRGNGHPGSRTPAIEALVEWLRLPLRRAGLRLVTIQSTSQ